MLGEKREYLTIKILHNDMTVMVPCCNADKAGLRRVIGEDDVKKVLGRPPRRREPDAQELEPALQAQPREDQDRRRLRARRGGPQPRDPRAGEGLSTGEKQMYTRAKKILASELMYALDMEEDEAETHLEELIVDAHTSRNGAGPARTA